MHSVDACALCVMRAWRARRMIHVACTHRRLFLHIHSGVIRNGRQIRLTTMPWTMGQQASARFELMSWFKASGTAHTLVEWRIKFRHSCPPPSASTFFSPLLFVFGCRHICDSDVGHSSWNIIIYFRSFSLWHPVYWTGGSATRRHAFVPIFYCSAFTVFAYRIKRETMIKYSCVFWLSAAIRIEHATCV